MKKIGVLLFDLDPANEAGKELQQLIEANRNDSFHLKYRMIDEREMPKAPRHLTSTLRGFSPDLAFMVFGATSRPMLAELFAVFRACKVALPILAVVNTGDPRAVKEVLYHGANDFLIPPFRPMNVLPRVWRWVEEARQEDASIHLLKENLGLKQFVGDSPAFLNEIRKIPAFARCDACVLIGGETGTGKEICARAIHCLSPRVSNPFVAVNCGAIPTELVENELFGHAPGAFTSAISSARGLIREADGGTLFLDEVDSLPLSAQVKLLRFLQEREFRPLGSHKTFKANLRIIAAANVDLEAATRAGRFRQDLYYRLNVVSISLPPLRLRQGDVPLLARYFVMKFTTRVGKPSKVITPAAMQKLVLYHWPGNVRELENVVERSVVLSENASIEGDKIVLPQSAAATGHDSFQALKAIAVAEFEHKYIGQLLATYEGNITKSALEAGKDRRSLQRLIRKHHPSMPGKPLSP